jgi:hypothetical protein
MELRRITGRACAVSGILVAAFMLMALVGSGTLAHSPEPPGMHSGDDKLRPDGDP